MNYNPNFTNSGNTAVQTVELTFQQWEYTATRTVEVGGNCTGLYVIQCAVESVLEELGGSDGKITLQNVDGDTLLCELWEMSLEDMLVSAKIISIEPKP